LDKENDGESGKGKNIITTKYCKSFAILCFFRMENFFRRLLWYYKEMQNLEGNKIGKNINRNSVS
jgi:hypothetical protein